MPRCTQPCSKNCNEYYRLWEEMGPVPMTEKEKYDLHVWGWHNKAWRDREALTKLQDQRIFVERAAPLKGVMPNA